MEDSVAVGSPRWVSQWARLASNQTRTDPEGSGAEPPAFVHQERGNLQNCMNVSPNNWYCTNEWYNNLIDYILELNLISLLND